MNTVSELIEYIKKENIDSVNREMFYKYFWIFEGIRRSSDKSAPTKGFSAVMNWHEKTKIELFKTLKENGISVTDINEHWVKNI